MKSYKKPVSCSASNVSAGVLPFALGILAGEAIKAVGMAAVGAAAASVAKELGDDFSLGFKPMDASPLKLGVV